MPKRIYEELRELTREYMAEKGVTQEALAKALGCEQQTVSTWLSQPERRLRQDSTELLVALLRKEKRMTVKLRRIG